MASSLRRRGLVEADEGDAPSVGNSITAAGREADVDGLFDAISVHLYGDEEPIPEGRVVVLDRSSVTSSDQV